MNKVQIDLSNFITNFSIKVQDTVSYEVLEKHENLEKEEAMKLVEELKVKYPSNELCEFMY